MSADIDSIKRKLLIKYPTFGSTIANLEFQESYDIPTAGTNGKLVLYNPDFLNSLSDKQQIFLFAHEICHVAFDHIFRSEGKNQKLWNIATDAVINALLQEDGLEIIEGGVDIPEAISYDAEQMYNKLLEEKKKQEQQQSEQGNQGQQGEQDNQQQQNSQGSQEGQNGQNSQQEENDIGHDTHSLWDKAIEDRKKEQQEQTKDKEKKEIGEKSKPAEQGERETFNKNKQERKKRLQELSKELAQESSHDVGDGIQREGRTLSDIGIAAPLIDWRKLLRQATRYEEEYTRKNARMRNGYFRHRLEQIPIPETEILLDVSGSVSETLLRNFLRECKNILDNSRVKVGCFNTKFHGFTEIRTSEDIDNMRFPIGGGTNFNSAVEAFSRTVPNKIIFTDGEAPMPRKTLRNVIWVVFGDRKINPRGGRVINITGKQLDRLYHSYRQESSKNDR